VQKMFLDGLHAHVSHLLEFSVTGPQTSFPVHFANDTFNGLVTFDKLQIILDASRKIGALRMVKHHVM
jgi:hypothetical protein